MKLYKSIVLGAALMLTATSCNDWLDVNTNPNSPTAESAQYQTLLPWIEFYTAGGYSIGGTNAACYAGNYLRSSSTRERNAAIWNLNASYRNVTIYQWFYVGAGPNIQNMYDKAMADGAYHYAGAARLIKAFGFMMLTDVFSEIPYTDALGSSNSPVYDNGKTVFFGCISDLDEAIELFQMEQADGAQPLSAGDSWNSGDTDKWIKFAYLLKARWLNHLSKKGDGEWANGNYDTSAILECLANAMQSNADNTVIHHTDTNGSTDILWGEPVDYSQVYSCIGMNSNFYITKTFYDNLTNFDGMGVEDPRADLLIPWARSRKSDNSPADVKWNDAGTWRRSLGVDLQTNILSNSGPFANSWNGTTNSWYCNTENDERLGDTVYVQMRTGSTGYGGKADILWRADDSNDASALSSVFGVRPTSPTYLGSYWEAKFIEAEVYMHLGNTSAAREALMAAVKAHMEAMNEQVEAWVAEDSSLSSCPSFVPMTSDEINDYVNNVIGGGTMSMGRIMTQKLLTEVYSLETWNDIRRHDYDTDVFWNWDISYEYKNTSTFWTYCPQGKQPRRWAPASHEINYNSENLKAIASEVPGIEELGNVETWYNADAVRTLHVWWDTESTD